MSAEPPKILVRQAHPDDLEAIEALIQPFIEQRRLLARTRDELLELMATGFTAVDDGVPIGFAAVELHALRGETDKALQALQAAVNEGSWLFWRWRLLHNPNLGALQGDIEFQAIVEQIEARMESVLDDIEAMSSGA